MPANANLGNRGCSVGGEAQAFTLVELLVSMTLIIILSGIVVQMTNQTSSIWRNSNARIQAFQEARAGFESMTRKLGQATLNTYYDYYNSNNTPRYLLTGANLTNFVPTTYDRVSDLHFISGQAATLLKGLSGSNKVTTQTHAVFFQAPLGYSTNYPLMENTLNACGYFLQFDDASATVPDHVKSTPGYKPRYRFRLMEMTQRAEEFSNYFNGAATAVQNNWYLQGVSGSSRVIAENVIALVVLPKLPRTDDTQGTALAPTYNYNSRVPLGASQDPAWTGADPSFPADKFTAVSNGSTTTGTRHHQLPPLLRVVMVVIDEASAARIQGAGATPPAGIDLSTADLFKDSVKLEDDIQKVEDICNAKTGNRTGNTMPLTYRVFSTDIIVHGAKWNNN